MSDDVLDATPAAEVLLACRAAAGAHVAIALGPGVAHPRERRGCATASGAPTCHLIPARAGRMLWPEPWRRPWRRLWWRWWRWWRWRRWRRRRWQRHKCGPNVTDAAPIIKMALPGGTARHPIVSVGLTPCVSHPLRGWTRAIAIGAARGAVGEPARTCGCSRSRECCWR
jgi:hypothetical protein